MPSKVSQKTIDLAKKMFIDGKSTTVIGDKIGKSTTWVYNQMKQCENYEDICKQRKANMDKSPPNKRKTKRRYHKKTIDCVIEMYNNDVTQKEIEKQTGMNRNDLFTVLQQRGIDPKLKKHRSRIPPDVLETAFNMYDNGMAVKEIQKITGTSREAFYKHLHKRKKELKLRNLSEKRLRKRGITLTDKNSILNIIGKWSDEKLCMEFQKATDGFEEFDRDTVKKIADLLAKYETCSEEMIRRGLEV
ncbi:MAG: helix-turn-helix domain-containing protein [Oscillospiraceae bacterium]|jgi:hypothetical protein|nr:helix-turn-helix domain-containing protein [Oscillospiraceae bacterium]